MLPDNSSVLFTSSFGFFEYFVGSFRSFIPYELPHRHSGEFMGIAPTGKRVEIRYMDFWKVVDGKIADNWVMVDFPHVLAQLGKDVFDGQGWEAFDRGDRAPPAPQRQPPADSNQKDASAPGEDAA